MVGKLFIKCLWQATKKALVQSYRILLTLARENHTIFKNSSCHVSQRVLVDLSLWPWVANDLASQVSHSIVLSFQIHYIELLSRYGSILHKMKVTHLVMGIYRLPKQVVQILLSIITVIPTLLPYYGLMEHSL